MSWTLLADAVVLEIGASVFLASAVIIGGCILLGLYLAGSMIRKSVDDLGAGLKDADAQHRKSHERQEDAHHEMQTTLSVMAAKR